MRIGLISFISIINGSAEVSVNYFHLYSTFLEESTIFWEVKFDYLCPMLKCPEVSWRLNDGEKRIAFDVCLALNVSFG